MSSVLWCDSSYWDYISQPQKDLIREGSYLYQQIFSDGKYSFIDYSFIVFPFAKAFEGFLKQVFFEARLIRQEEYYSDHIRLGRLLSPHLVYKLEGNSLYLQISSRYSRELADQIWLTWKSCRNELFHYYPHNVKSLTLVDAKERIDQIVVTMTQVFKWILLKNCKSPNIAPQEPLH